MTQGIPIIFEFDDNMVGDKDARYGYDHFFDEPHNEPTTIKLTPSMKRRLIKFGKLEGYTNLSATIRELITLGLEYYPVKARHDAEQKLAALDLLLKEA